MATSPETKKTRLRKEGEGNPPEASIAPASSVLAQQPQPPQIAPDIRDQLSLLFQELFVKTQELSFEYSTLECDDIRDCPLAQKCKELFKVTKKINEYVRKMVQPAGAA
jgi:hypothetical protein